jgi:hypothetical protein
MQEQNAEPAIDVVRDFLGFKVADAESMDEIRADVRRTAQVSTRKLRRELAALEAVLADPPPVPGALARMVAWEGNWVLDDPSDAGAARFLASWLRSCARSSTRRADGGRPRPWCRSEHG